MRTGRHLKAVLWSFVGLGRPQDLAELERNGKPLLLIATGLACALLFVAALVGLASFAVSALRSVG